MARDRKFAAILAWVKWVRRGGGGEVGYFSFQPVSPQAFSEFESKMALARSKCARSRLRSPKYARIAG